MLLLVGKFSRKAKEVQLFFLSTTAPTEWEGDGSDDKPDGWEKDGWESDGHDDPTFSP